MFILGVAQGQSTALPSAPGSEAAVTEGVYRLGGPVRPPVLVHQVDPEYSEQARRKKVSGSVRVSCIVDREGVPTSLRVVKGLGGGLDEKAVEAVSQYRFRPATLEGRPVAVEMTIDVTFQIF